MSPLHNPPIELHRSQAFWHFLWSFLDSSAAVALAGSTWGQIGRGRIQGKWLELMDCGRKAVDFKRVIYIKILKRLISTVIVVEKIWQENQVDTNDYCPKWYAKKW